MSNTIVCPACDHPAAKVSPTKTLGFSVSCGECGFQGFAKSPKAADGIKAKIAPAPEPGPALDPPAPAKPAAAPAPAARKPFLQL